MAVNMCPTLLFLLGLFMEWRTAQCFTCYHKLTAEKGTLMSQVNLAPFYKPTVCTWEIKVAVGFRVQVDLRVFEIETSCCSCAEDFVEFRDGLNSTSPLIGRYCAKNQPEKIYSSANLLRVEFYSSVKPNKNMSSVNKFRAEYRAICGGLLRDRLGQITSPGYPGFSRGHCIFTIVVPFGWVKLSFDQFEVGATDSDSELCKKDYVAVKEMSLVEFKDGPRTQTLCGKLKSKYFYSTGGRELSLLYISTSAGNRFLAKFEAVTNGTGECGGLVRKNSGYIYSLGFPQQFPSNTRCIWNIEVPHSFIELRFLIFNFSESSTTCAHGQVDIFDGWAVTSVKIRTNCGLIKTPPRIISRTNRLLIRARSTNSARTGIFLLSYKIVEEGLCRASEFSCVSRECISRDWVCDGKNDCSDGSEELNCPAQKRNKTLYALWVLVVFIATVLMGFWLWRTWRKAVRHTATIPHEHHPDCLTAEDYDYEPTSQTEAPPSYSEALLQTDDSLPTYEEAVGDNEDRQQVLLGRDNVRFMNPSNGLPSSQRSDSTQVRPGE